jgi:hypothetical protein
MHRFIRPPSAFAVVDSTALKRFRRLHDLLNRIARAVKPINYTRADTSMPVFTRFRGIRLCSPTTKFSTKFSMKILILRHHAALYNMRLQEPWESQNG